MRKFLLLVVMMVSSFAMAATPHGENFTWNNSTNASLMANNFYCGTATGGPYNFVWNLVPVNTTFFWTTADTVNPPVQGTKYFCIVTDVASNGIESGPSNEVSFTFPVVPLPPTGLSRSDR